MQRDVMAQGAFPVLGVNLRRDRLNLEDQDLAKAINADLHTEVGTILLRLGRSKQNSTALADVLIRRMARINSNRYRVAGQSVYCGTTKVLDGTLSTNQITTLAPFRPLNDDTIWAFVGDDSTMKKLDCTTAKDWGFGEPETPEIKIGYKTGLTGTYSMRYSGIRFASSKVAHEGNPIAATDDVSPSSQDICIGKLEHTSGDVNGFGLYRTTNGGSSHLLVEREEVSSLPAHAVTFTWEASAQANTLLLHWAIHDTTQDRYVTQAWEVSGNETASSEDTNGYRSTTRWAKDVQELVTTQTYRWAYSSQQADTALTDAVTIDNNPPPNCSYILPHQEHMFFMRDASNPHYLWYSKRFRPESVGSNNFIEIGNADDPLQCGATVGGLFGVFSRQTKYQIVGNVASGFVHVEAPSKRGTPCPMAVLGTEFGILFPARDGIFATNLVSVDTELSNDIEPLFHGEAVNGFEAINWERATTFSAAVYKRRYYFSYCSGTSQEPDMLAVYSADTAKWYFYDHPLRSLLYEEDTDLLLGGGQDGFVHVMENTNADDGGNISLDVETKEFHGGDKDILKMFQWLTTDVDTQSETVTCEFYVDGTLRTTLTLTTATRKVELHSLPQAVLGYRWRVRFTYTGQKRIKLYPPKAVELPLAVA